MKKAKPPVPPQEESVSVTVGNAEYLDPELEKHLSEKPTVTIVPLNKLSILRKLHAIMEETSFVQKTGFRKDQQWKYASDSDVLRTVRKQLVKRRITVTPNLLKMWTIDVGQQGGRGYITHVIVRWDFTDIETGSCLSVTMPGSGYDIQSTGSYKAITGSDKYALLKTLQFITSDDPEEDDVGTQEHKAAEMRAKEAEGVNIPGATQVESEKPIPSYQDEDYEPWDFNHPKTGYADEFGNDFEKEGGKDWWKDVPMKVCAAVEKHTPGKKVHEITPGHLVQVANRWIPHVDDEHHGYRGLDCRKLAAACKERLKIEIAAGTIVERKEPLADGTAKSTYHLQERSSSEEKSLSHQK